MTREMKEFYDSLQNVKVRNVVAAYDVVGEAINEMDLKGELDFEMTHDALKRINRDFKKMKQYYKGKININPREVLNQYDEGSQEHYFFKCVLKLMEYYG